MTREREPQPSLFATPQPAAPLADRLRPRHLDEVVGQAHLLGPGQPLRAILDGGRLHSMVLWGPPGTGKTTLARLMAQQANLLFLSLSAVQAGIREVREAVDAARRERSVSGRGTVLFLDEVHRFNKAQQDAFLPHIEDGTLVFIGATTENPSFELNRALLSRARVYVLRALDEADLGRVLERALTDAERGLGGLRLEVPESARRLLIEAADGDARRLLGLLELGAELVGAGGPLDALAVERLLTGAGARQFDKGGDLFFDQISALHKAVRGSSPDGALYWLARMLDGGADPLYVARRLVRMASEDIGNADPRALQLALNAWETQERLGSPEGHLALAQAAVFLACAPKSNAVYRAFDAARADATRHGSLPVPLHLRNAPTALMKQLGHGRAYRYAHDEPDAYAAGEQYLPEALGEARYYHPVPRGLELRIGERLALLRERDRRARAGEAPAPEQNP
ncbi:MAG TPA: replication-associated recombination protein A [Candidatus Macondimonas sp.]|nr:replication-associated recombination protein A [Candidatus Macondimonas sp.]